MNRLGTGISTLALAAGVALFAAGCSKDEDKGDQGAKQTKGDKAGKADKGASKNAGGCDRREKEALCGEYHGNLAKPDWVKEQCAAMSVPYVEACPKDGAVGRCVLEAGTPQETQTVWYAPTTRETVTAMCSGGEVRDP